jgi:hypothetical protein
MPAGKTKNWASAGFLPTIAVIFGQHQWRSTAPIRWHYLKDNEME